MTTEWYPFVKILAKGGVGVKIFQLIFEVEQGKENDFLIVGQTFFLPRKTFLFGATAWHK